MITRVAVVSLWAPDVHEAMHFYRDVLKLQPLPGHDDPPHLIVSGTILAILKGKPWPPLDPSPDRFPVLAFAVEDLELALAALERAGIELPWGVEGTPETPWVQFHDPAGNLIELAQLPAHH